MKRIEAEQFEFGFAAMDCPVPFEHNEPEAGKILEGICADPLHGLYINLEGRVLYLTLEIQSDGEKKIIAAREL